jgi:hypothetical protein
VSTSSELEMQQELVRLLRRRCEQQEEELQAALLREVHEGLTGTQIDHSSKRPNGDTHLDVSSLPRLDDISSVSSIRSGISDKRREYHHHHTPASTPSHSPSSIVHASTVPALSRKLQLAEQEAYAVLKKTSS